MKGSCYPALIAVFFVIPCAAAQSIDDFNQRIDVNADKIPGFADLKTPVAPDALQVSVNGRLISWIVPNIDPISGRVSFSLTGGRGDTKPGEHARELRNRMRVSGEHLAVCLNVKNKDCVSFDVTVVPPPQRDLPWIAVLMIGALPPLFCRRLVSTRIRDQDGDRTGRERISLSASIFYTWNIAVLTSIVFVWSGTGQWTVNQTAMSLLALGGATRGGAKMVTGSRVAPNIVSTQPICGMALGASAPQATPVVSDPSLPGPAPHPPATPPSQSDDSSASPIPTVLAAIAQPILSILSQTLTDEDGPALHRIQLAVWTVLLLTWYARAVYMDWALPDFDVSLVSIGVISGGFHVLSKGSEVISRRNAPMIGSLR